MKKLTVLDRQNIFDIAIQVAGNTEAAFELALLNDLSITDNMEVGLELTTVEKTNRPVADYYDAKQLKPATAATDEQFNEITGEGIGFMGIEIDFKVS